MSHKKADPALSSKVRRTTAEPNTQRAVESFGEKRGTHLLPKVVLPQGYEPASAAVMPPAPAQPAAASDQSPPAADPAAPAQSGDTGT